MKEYLHEIKTKLKKEILEKVDAKDFIYSTDNKDQLQKQLDDILNSILKIEKRYLRIDRAEKEEMISQVVSEIIGLGPIEQLLNDPSVLEIMINGPYQVFIEKDGRIRHSGVKFNNQEHLAYFIDKMLAPLGRRVTELDPYVDARLNDGSRVNIVRSPIAVNGPIVTIRKFSKNILTIDNLIELGTLDAAAARFLDACVKARLNILISGGAGVGKTTTLNVLGSFIPDEERIIVIEDVTELKIDKQHIVYLEARPANIEGKGEIPIRPLVKNALHMRPDRIIVGEVRSEEVLDMLQAMNTGHDGSMATVHANSPEEALERLEMLALMGSSNITTEVARKQIVYAVNLIVHLARFSDGLRKITRISEVVKEKSADFSLKDLFVLEEADLTHARRLRHTGAIPDFYLRLKQAGLPADFFEKNKQ